MFNGPFKNPDQQAIFITMKIAFAWQSSKNSKVVVVDGDDSSGRKRFVVWNKRGVLELEYKK